MSFILYLITNKINGKVYIGQTTRSIEVRWEEHERDYKKLNHILYTAIRKHKIENFQIDELCCCNNQDELDSAETFLIDILGSHKHMFGYNQRLGGSPGRYSEESKKMFSKLAKTRFANMSKEEVNAITLRMRIKKQELKALGFIVDSTGHKHKPESLQKMRVVKLGKKQTEESNIKRSNTHKKIVKTEKHIKNAAIGTQGAWDKLTLEQRLERGEKVRHGQIRKKMKQMALALLSA